MSPLEAVVRFIATALAGYLLGSIPSGVLAGKLFGNRDPRAGGSGKTGATECAAHAWPWPSRSRRAGGCWQGRRGGASGALRLLGGQPELRDYAEALAGFAAIIGHNYSIYIRFGGGRGVLTGADGAMLIMSPFATLIGFICAAIPIALTRSVSLELLQFLERPEHRGVVGPATHPPRLVSTLRLHSRRRYHHHPVAPRQHRAAAPRHRAQTRPASSLGFWSFPIERAIRQTQAQAPQPGHG